MSRHHPRNLAVLPLAAGLLATAVVGCRASGETPGLVAMQGMLVSVPADPWEQSTVLPGGENLLHPPDGTVPYGAPKVVFGPTKEEAARAGRILTNPIAPDAKALRRGQVVFETFCRVCHGPTGQGDGPVIGAGRMPNPPVLVSGRATQLPDGHIFHVVTYGQGLMASYATQIRPADRWRVIHYVRKLQRPAPGGAP